MFDETNVSTILTYLKDSPCVGVENGRRFVNAKCIAIKLDESEELKPYLYSLPMELGPFHRLFKYLGKQLSSLFSALVNRFMHKTTPLSNLEPFYRII